MLLALPFALAHSPHDIVRGLAVVGGELLTGEEIRLARSPDDGDTLIHVNSPAGAPTCIAPIVGSPHAFLLVTDEGALFRSLDAGASWSQLVGSGVSVCAPAVRGALVVTRLGLLRVLADTEEPVSGDAVPLLAVAESAWGEVVGVTEEGSYAALVGGVWEVGAPFGYTTVVAGDGVLLRAGQVGIEVNEGEGEWRFVHDLAAVTLGASEAGWQAAGLVDGVLVSTDRGQNWAWVTEGLEVSATGGGAPKEGAPHWFTLLGDGDTLWAGAWEGLYRMRAGETAWTQIELRGQPMIRDLAWIGDELLVADNGAGLLRGTPGKDDWADAAPDLDWPWLRTIVPTEGGEGRWYFSGGVLLYQTDNAGAKVRAVDSGLDGDGDCIAVAPDFPDDPRAWAGGVVEDGTGAVTETVDGGQTWTPIRLSGCSEKPAAMSTGGGGVWVACDASVWFGGHGAFEFAAAAAERVTALVDDEGGVLVGTADGLFRVVLGAGPTAVWEEARVDALAREPDGAVLAATSQGLVRFRDGVSPEALGWPDADVILALSVNDDGRIAAGGYTGAWVSDDGGVTFASATDWDRFDDRDTAFLWSDGWEWETDSGAKAGRAHHTGAPSAYVRWRVYARQLRLLGRGQGQLAVSVDGNAVADVSVSRDDHGPIFGLEVEEGWHDVFVTPVDGEVWLDGGERWRHTAGHADPPAEAPAPDCACGGGAGPAGLVPGLTALVAVLACTRRGAMR